MCEYVQSDTTIFASNITGGIKQLHVSTLYVGHLQVVIRLSDQLCRNAWSALGEFWGRGRGVRDLVITVGAMAPGYLQVKYY